ncbi:MAG: hypothetical protein LC808_22255, partial [Actinobacteria bacterium]|nr:hypothetical protein [Actinomycetota bacterium]
ARHIPLMGAVWGNALRLQRNEAVAKTKRVHDLSSTSMICQYRCAALPVTLGASQPTAREPA